MNSIISKNFCCYICGSNRNLEIHHCIHGTANRKLAEEDGLTVYLCHSCHADLHDKGLFDKSLQSIAQKAYIEKYGSREDFRRRYGRYYDL